MNPLHKHVLWVEGDVDNREVVDLFLGQSGYCVTSATTSIEAMSLARSEPFDLYLLGDWLPYGKEGELCGQLHQYDSRGPILFYSAAAYQTDRQRGMGAGAQDYLTKPAGLDELEQTISRLLDEAPVPPPSEMRAAAGQGRKSSPRRLGAPAWPESGGGDG